MKSVEFKGRMRIEEERNSERGIALFRGRHISLRFRLIMI